MSRHLQTDILLVDDRFENLLSLQAALEPLHQNLVFAASGEEALRLLLEREFAVILLDVNLPGINGFETAALVRERESTSHTPIIFLTAMDPADAQVQHGYSLGAVDFLFKPIEVEVLRAKVNVFVELYRKTREIALFNIYLEHRVHQRTREIEETNLELQREVAERLRAEMEVRQLNADLEQRVRERTAALEDANRELEAFTYSVSHDLRAPLRKLDGLSKLFLEDHADLLDESARMYLNRMAAAGRQMNNIIDDLLTLSRVSRNELVREDIDLSPVAEEIAEDLLRSRPDVPADFNIQKEVIVHGDRRLVQLALRNLLENAWKFSSKRPLPRIEFGTTNGAGACFVRDNGAGFDMNHAANMFTPFERLHPSVEFPGTGIGLAIVKRVVQRHGGRVWAESAVNEGATFFFTVG